jgi:nucleoside-diphosphate-sugar epimerase
MANCSILGCGWLGLPLGAALVSQGYRVHGATTRATKFKLLTGVGILPFEIALSAGGIRGNIDDFLAETDILILDVPPTDRFADAVRLLVQHMKKAKITKVVFTSSVSVYRDQNGVADENAVLSNNEKARQIIAVENLLQEHFETTVLRLGGLIGEDRHPVKYLSGRKGIENPDAAVNLIHQKDCIGIILEILQQNVWGETFNAVAPSHLSRETYYTGEAESRGLPVPMFDHSKPSAGKTVSSEKLIRALAYDFQYLP